MPPVEARVLPCVKEATLPTCNTGLGSSRAVICWPLFASMPYFAMEEIEILFEEQTDRFDLADPDHARRSDGYGRRRAFGGLEHRGPGEDERARHDDQGHSYNT